MATLSFPIPSNIRFYRENTKVNYSTYYPNADRMRQGINYHRGIETKTYQQDFIKNETISCLIFLNDAAIPRLNVTLYKPNGNTDSISAQQISIPGYAANNYVFIIQITPSQVGEYFLLITALESQSDVYKSDVFYVHDRADVQKELVKVKYTDSQNRYGGYWYKSSGSLIYTPHCYYEGRLLKGDNESDETRSEDELGNEYLLFDNVKSIYDLNLINVHIGYADIIAHQFACNQLYVNEINFTKKSIRMERIKNTDLVNFEIKLIEVKSNFLLNI